MTTATAGPLVVEIYRDGAPCSPHPCPADIIPLPCCEYRCSLSMQARDGRVLHRTGAGHEHTLTFPVEMLEDVDADIWGHILEQILDVHGSMGMV